MLHLAEDVDAAVRAVAPTILGVSIGRAHDKSTWVVHFSDEATDEHRQAAASALAAFSMSASAEARRRLAVKAEARRRILARFPEWKQQNMTARGVELQDIWRRVGSWTAQEQADSEALTAAWAWINGIRDKSDALEAMIPIPIDYTSDQYWT